MNVLARLAAWMAPRAKAIGGGAGTVLLLTLGLARDGLSLDDWQTIIETTLGVMGIVYAVPNQTPKR